MEKYEIKRVASGKFRGRPIALTLERGHYCVEYTDSLNEPSWWAPCEEDEDEVRRLYEKYGNTDEFFNALGNTMLEWDYDIHE